MTCKHEHTCWAQGPANGNELRCQDCEVVLAWECEHCNGMGDIFEDDWYGDYVNCDDIFEDDYDNCHPDLMPCPECGGNRVVWADENTRQQIQTRWKAEQE